MRCLMGRFYLYLSQSLTRDVIFHPLPFLVVSHVQTFCLLGGPSFVLVMKLHICCDHSGVLAHISVCTGSYKRYSADGSVCVRACVHACVRACVYVCVYMCVCVCVCPSACHIFT